MSKLQSPAKPASRPIKKRARTGALSCLRILSGLLDQSHVLGLQSLRSLLDFELHLRAFVQ